jgi:hypothetical protein
MANFDKKNILFFSASSFFQVLVIKTLVPDRYSAKNASSGSGSGINEYGTETLI